MNTQLFQGEQVNSNRILYTPSEFAKNNLIHLQEIGKLQAKEPHTSSRVGLSSYLFFLVTSGSGTLQFDGTLYELHAGSCVFIDCHKAYSHCSSTDLWNLKWAHFYGPNMAAIYKKYVERGGRPSFTTEHFSDYANLLDKLHETASSPDYIKDMKIFEQLTSLLTLLMADSWTPYPIDIKNPAGKRSLQDVKEYLDSHFHEKIMLDELATNFYINKYYLTRIFKEQFGISISHYLLQQRITHAKQLLRFTDYSIEQIGQLCGIEDANYFARAFKKVEGISPGEFRKRW